MAQYMMNPHFVEHLSSYEYGALMQNELIRNELVFLINQFNRKEFEEHIQKMINKKRREKLPGTKFDTSEFHKKFDDILQSRIELILKYANRDQFVKFVKGLFTLDQILARIQTGQQGQVYEVLDDLKQKLNLQTLQNNTLFEQLAKRITAKSGTGGKNVELLNIEQKCYNSIFFVPKSNKKQKARELMFNRQQK